MKRLTAILLSAACLALRHGGRLGAGQYPEPHHRSWCPMRPAAPPTSPRASSATKMQKITGQPFVIIDKPGAFGLLAIDEMVKAAPDGYTLMIGNVTTNAITPILYSEMTFDYARA